MKNIKLEQKWQNEEENKFSSNQQQKTQKSEVKDRRSLIKINDQSIYETSCQDANDQHDFDYACNTDQSIILKKNFKKQIQKQNKSQIPQLFLISKHMSLENDQQNELNLLFTTQRDQGDRNVIPIKQQTRDRVSSFQPHNLQINKYQSDNVISDTLEQSFNQNQNIRKQHLQFNQYFKANNVSKINDSINDKLVFQCQSNSKFQQQSEFSEEYDNVSKEIISLNLETNQDEFQENVLDQVQEMNQRLIVLKNRVAQQLKECQISSIQKIGEAQNNNFEQLEANSQESEDKLRFERQATLNQHIKEIQSMIELNENIYKQNKIFSFDFQNLYTKNYQNEQSLYYLNEMLKKAEKKEQNILIRFQELENKYELLKRSDEIHQEQLSKRENDLMKFQNILYGDSIDFQSKVQQLNYQLEIKSQENLKLQQQFIQFQNMNHIQQEKLKEKISYLQEQLRQSENFIQMKKKDFQINQSKNEQLRKDLQNTKLKNESLMNQIQVIENKKNVIKDQKQILVKEQKNLKQKYQKLYIKYIQQVSRQKQTLEVMGIEVSSQIDSISDPLEEEIYLQNQKQSFFGAALPLHHLETHQDQHFNSDENFYKQKICSGNIGIDARNQTILKSFLSQQKLQQQRIMFQNNHNYSNKQENFKNLINSAEKLKQSNHLIRDSIGQNDQQINDVDDDNKQKDYQLFQNSIELINLNKTQMDNKDSNEKSKTKDDSYQEKIRKIKIINNIQSPKIQNKDNLALELHQDQFNLNFEKDDLQFNDFDYLARDESQQKGRNLSHLKISNSEPDHMSASRSHLYMSSFLSKGVPSQMNIQSSIKDNVHDIHHKNLWLQSNDKMHYNFRQTHQKDNKNEKQSEIENSIKQKSFKNQMNEDIYKSPSLVPLQIHNKNSSMINLGQMIYNQQHQKRLSQKEMVEMMENSTIRKKDSKQRSISEVWSSVKRDQSLQNKMYQEFIIKQKNLEKLVDDQNNMSAVIQQDDGQLRLRKIHNANEQLNQNVRNSQVFSCNMTANKSGSKIEQISNPKINSQDTIFNNYDKSESVDSLFENKDVYNYCKTQHKKELQLNKLRSRSLIDPLQYFSELKMKKYQKSFQDNDSGGKNSKLNFPSEKECLQKIHSINKNILDQTQSVIDQINLITQKEEQDIKNQQNQMLSKIVEDLNENSIQDRQRNSEISQFKDQNQQIAQKTQSNQYIDNQQKLQIDKDANLQMQNLLKQKSILDQQSNAFRNDALNSNRSISSKLKKISVGEQNENIEIKLSERQIQQQQQQIFLNKLHSSRNQWDRYSDLLTNDIKFDSKKLINKYLNHMPGNQSGPSNLVQFNSNLFFKPPEEVKQNNQINFKYQDNQTKQEYIPQQKISIDYQKHQKLTKQINDMHKKPPLNVNTKMVHDYQQSLITPASKESLVTALFGNQEKGQAISSNKVFINSYNNSVINSKTSNLTNQTPVTIQKINQNEHQNVAQWNV